ncbi:ATP-binding protein [Nocardiopsis sp. NPDC058789]|uniref:ATP-binding protein n=1 Tax=Nocardiopsis eucommiae TaxID=2831970 RepID=A0A975L8U7_9ACTN|nr:ATP-binding protein [Nocardiopsis eucommiae]
MSGDNAAHDDGGHGAPRKVERSVVLPYVPESVTGARRALCADLRALGVRVDRIDDAALILSELVSNALRHASPLPDDTVGVCWRADADPEAPAAHWLEISVRDGGSTTMPRVSRPSLSGLGGRGLGIVQSLAGRWGTEMDATTTTVWAVLEIDVERAETADDLPASSEAGPVRAYAADVVELDLGTVEGQPAWSVLP